MSVSTNKYSQIALMAVEMLKTGQLSDPVVAWEQAAEQVYPDRKPARTKACPKGAFLGLCEAGLITLVQPGNYTSSIDNKNYAVYAVKLLKKNPRLADDHNKLWMEVLAGEFKSHNNQMNVVISLWTAGYITSN